MSHFEVHTRHYRTAFDDENDSFDEYLATDHPDSMRILRRLSLRPSAASAANQGSVGIDLHSGAAIGANASVFSLMKSIC